MLRSFKRYLLTPSVFGLFSRKQGCRSPCALHGPIFEAPRRTTLGKISLRAVSHPSLLHCQAKPRSKKTREPGSYLEAMGRLLWVPMPKAMSAALLWCEPKAFTSPSAGFCHRFNQRFREQRMFKRVMHAFLNTSTITLAEPRA